VASACRPASTRRSTGPEADRSTCYRRRRARSSVAEQGTFNPPVVGSNPTGPSARPNRRMLVERRRSLVAGHRCSRLCSRSHGVRYEGIHSITPMRGSRVLTAGRTSPWMPFRIATTSGEWPRPFVRHADAQGKAPNFALTELDGHRYRPALRVRATNALPTPASPIRPWHQGKSLDRRPGWAKVEGWLVVQAGGVVVDPG
jgi:hypothetical protein